MNYTQPQDENHQDKSEDWLISSLVFAKAIGMLLEPEEGIVVHLENDMKKGNMKEVDKVIVYNGLDNMLHVIECKEDLADGQMITMKMPINEN